MIRIEKIKKIYNQGKSNEFEALKDITCNIHKGSWTTIVGASGSGKSTFLKCISGLEKVTSGKIVFVDEELTSMTERSLLNLRRKEMSFVFQDYNLIDDLKMIENIFLENPVKSEIMDLAKNWGLSNVLYKFPNECSGGQRQKVAILRALNQKSSIIFCDEPTGALDTNSSKDVLQVLKQVNEQYGTTIVMVTHNNLIKEISDFIITIHDGEILSYHENDSVKGVENVQW